MYYNDHFPPHFHARYGNYEATYCIDNLKLISGNLPNRANSLVIEWAFKYRDRLLENWHLLLEKKTLKKINPLK